MAAPPLAPPPLAGVDPVTALADRYVVERELGRGGMGSVWLARDRQLDRPVALKVLPREFAAEPDLRERFLRETRFAASFSHPHIVPVFAVEERDGLLAFAMGFVEGESLAERVRRAGPLGTRDLVRLLQDVGYALAYAHGRGVVHRDIKPENIMLERATGRALVMDFGIARTIAPAAAGATRAGLTRVGEVVGTPEYMSPEQAAGDALDGRSDLYALGLVAWFAASGEVAMAGETAQRILVRQLTEPVPPVATVRPGLPAALAALIDRCTRKEPAERPADAAALVDALDAAQLAAPEVAVAVRFLARDLAGVPPRVVLALVLVVIAVAQRIVFRHAELSILAVLAIASAWARGAFAVREVRRLRAAGFTVEALHRQVATVLAEQREEREQRRGDASEVRARRRTVAIMWVLLLTQLASVITMLWHHDPATGRLRLSARLDATPVILRFFGGLLAVGIATSVLLRSPFRTPLGERLLAAWWARPWAVRLLARCGAGPARVRAATDASRPAPRPRAAVAPAAPVAALRGAAPDLAARVDALEARLRTVEARLDA